MVVVVMVLAVMEMVVLVMLMVIERFEKPLLAPRSEAGQSCVCSS